MEKYGQYRDKGTGFLSLSSPTYTYLHNADSPISYAGSGVAPFFPIAPPPSNIFLAPYHVVCFIFNITSSFCIGIRVLMMF